MMKKLIFIIVVTFGATKLYAQIKLPPKDFKCDCPPLTLGVYDTKVNFTTDSAVEKDNYAKAQKSGDYLESLYAKQESDQLKVIRVPKQGTVSEMDFKTNTQINRSGNAGNYTYNVSVQITDAYTQAVVKNKKKTTDNLAKADEMIDSCVASFGSVLDSTIRKYQKKLRKESNNTKWIGLQWQVKPDSKKLKKNKATTVTITVTDCISKILVPKLKMHITQTNPNAGILSATDVTTNDSGKVAVIFMARNKGETIILPSFSYTGVNNKIIKDPIACVAPKITVDEDFLYKITMDAEYTVNEAGRDIKLHGESITSLKPLADGTYMLEPIDKSRNMNITVEKGESVNADGATGELTTPLQYTIPFLFILGKIDKSLSSAHAIAYLNTTSPQKGKVTWVYAANGKTVTNIIDIDKGTITYIPGSTIQVPGNGGNLYALDNVTNLNLLTNLMFDKDLATKNINQNISNAQDQIAFAKRMQAHMNDSNYFKTAQGKKDMQQMQLLQQQVGGNVVNKSSTTKNINAEIAQKIKDDPNYAGSDQFHQDMGKLQLSSIADKDLYQKSAMAEVSPGTAMVRIEGDFDTNSTEAFNESLQKSIGSMTTSVKITVEKIE